MLPSADDKSPIGQAAEWVARIASVALLMVLPGLGGNWLDRALGHGAAFHTGGFCAWNSCRDLGSVGDDRGRKEAEVSKSNVGSQGCLNSASVFVSLSVPAMTPDLPPHRPVWRAKGVRIDCRCRGARGTCCCDARGTNRRRTDLDDDVAGGICLLVLGQLVVGRRASLSVARLGHGWRLRGDVDSDVDSAGRRRRGDRRMAAHWRRGPVRATPDLFSADARRRNLALLGACAGDAGFHDFGSAGG